jgi:hypothetical protein
MSVLLARLQQKAVKIRLLASSRFSVAPSVHM